jgi:glycosyltransferase involved in cell wall biosynthesis
VIAVSAEVAGHLEKDFKVAGQRIELVNNGIDAGRFCRRGDTGRNRVRRELGVGDSQVLIGSVGRLSDVKGHIYLVEAMKEVVSRYPQAQLLIVGEGKMKEEILALRSLLKLEKNIQLIPGLDDPREALAAMDIFVMPSLKEGLGLALMEAMASGLPVVASDVGGIKSLVSDGVNGLLVSPGKPALIAQALLRLIASPEERAKLGSRAVSDIINNYPLEQMAQKTERAYEQCLK